jgi:hypothetical protein
MSNKNYTAALYCSTIEGWWYASAAPVTILSKDNGGK